MKKLISLLLIISLITFYLSSKTNAQDESLYSFLSSNKNINAYFVYPSYTAADDKTGKSHLAAHYPVIIRNINPINTKSINSGDTVFFSTVKDIKDESGNILILKGSTVSATIFFTKKGFIGKSAELSISDFHTIAVDGTYIPLSSTIAVNPDDKMVASIVLSLFICPLFLLMKGKDAELPAMTTKTIYTMYDTYIKTETI